jgi:glycosyltransferase involved in cell wall biosynthesis
MKILQVSTNDNSGGAARAAYRLHQALNKNSNTVESEMLVLKKRSDDSRVHTLSDSLFHKTRPFLEALPFKKYKNKQKVPYSSSWVPYSLLTDKISELNPDIVHLHWVNEGLLRIEDLAKINRPIVWSLHDMWAFTGGCHYNENCEKFMVHCNKCPILRSNINKDISYKTFHRKMNAYREIKSLTIIGLSNWLANSASESLLFANRRVINLPNPIDVDIFKPFDKEIARNILNLPQEENLILFGAMGGTSDRRKGFFELSEALKGVNEYAHLVIIGCNQPKEPQGFKQKAHYLGHVGDDVTLRLVYSAVDVMVVPSLQENLSNSIMESLSCGTPVVGFDIGGNSDMIEHKENGYLAISKDTTNLAEGINWVLNKADYEILCRNSRHKVCNEFDSDVVASKYIALYSNILNYISI